MMIINEHLIFMNPLCVRRFYQKFGMPGVIGAVDGTLICIIPPKENEEQFFSRKHCHSINAQIVSKILKDFLI